MWTAMSFVSIVSKGIAPDGDRSAVKVTSKARSVRCLVSAVLGWKVRRAIQILE
jgi:hypothetical protein